MSDDIPAFQDLLKITTGYANALKPVELHGFLTGVVIGPEDTADEPILTTAFGFTAIDRPENYAELGELLWDANDEIAEDLIDASFDVVLRIDDNSPEDLTLWMQGFNKAVALNEAGWEEMNDSNIETGKKYAYIQSLANPKLAEILFGVPQDEYDKYLEEALPLLSDALIALYHGYWLDQPLAESDITIDDLPSFNTDALARQTDDELLKTILTYDDLLPRSVVDAAIRRGQPMAVRLRRHLEDPTNWADDVPVGHWWGLIHAAFTLGFISGDDATQGLLYAIKRMDSNDDLDLWDWLAGSWPALFRNKRTAASAGLQEIAANRMLDWNPRTTALECLLEAAHAAGPRALDEMLQRIAISVADESEDWDYRIITSHFLIDFPRDAHRQLLEKLVYEQKQQDDIYHYHMSDVDDVYALREDRLEWERFDDPLAFYDPENILNRQIRWADEDEDLLLDDPRFEEPDDLPYLYDPLPPITYVRETPKIGRNDPCPCGSGKKYKKCCLKKLH